LSGKITNSENSLRNAVSDAYNFEAFVIELLRNHILLQGKHFETGRMGDSEFDGFAPDGFDEFEHPVIVECIATPTQSRILKIASAARNYLDFMHKKAGKPYAAILLIVVNEWSAWSQRIHGIGSEPAYFGDLKLVIWSWPQLDALANRHPADSKRIVKNLLPLRVRNVEKNAPSSWQDERDKRVRELADQFQSGPFSLFLGAGVSSSAGMPDWNSLLNALFMAYINGSEVTGDNDASSGQTLELVRRMNTLDTPSALVSARYLRKGIAGNSDDRRSFTAAIRKALYGLRRKDRKPASPLIVNLAQLCMPRRTGAKVRAVVTYNFDDLFERELKSRSISHRSIYSQSQQPDIEELPVYHVHGFIPQETEPYNELDDATLVFAEEGYHQMYTDAYHWSNLVQLHALRDSTCLMVGLSMADPNLRRLLEIAQRGVKDSRHFAFMKKISTDTFLAAKVDEAEQRPITREAADEFLQRHYALTETLMRELGVTVIWFESYDEIPVMLGAVGSPTTS